MDYSREYSANMDWVRERYKLIESTNLYEIVGRMVEEIKLYDLDKLKEEQSLLAEEKPVIKKKKESKKCQKKTKTKKV